MSHTQRSLSRTLTQHWLALVLVGIILTRIPLLWIGYGSDADAWRVAYVGETLLQTGEYQVSRFPGYPLHEILSAPFVSLGGAPLSNAATLLAALICILVLTRIVLREAKHPRLLVVCLAFSPLFLKSSATTMDYVLSLLFLLLALDAALKKRTVAAAIWLGVAAGFRPSNFVAMIPLISLLYLNGSPRRDLLKFCAASIVCGAIAFLPVIVTYGLLNWVHITRFEMSDIVFSPVDRLLFFGYRGVYALGPLGVLSAGTVLLLHRRAVIQQVRMKQPIFISSLIGVVTFMLLYFSFPLEREYLLPAFPFLYLLLDSVATKRQLIVFMICVFSFAFINPDVIRHHGFRGTPEFNVHSGMLIEEWQKRTQLLEQRTRIASLELQGKALVMTGGGAVFWFQNPLFERDPTPLWQQLDEHTVHQKRNPDVHYVPMLNRSELELARSEGYAIYCMENAKEYIERMMGYTMDEAGVVVLE
ncbi:MAG: hypothetical protein O7D34_12725 [Ignavibacteria bacterium]|nr:hypothetical protein [Ignavibacteria bacterium]